MVGAVLVKNGRIVAGGFHRRFGAPHAEVECINAHRGDFRNSILYVNLEPCSHYGKTQPCVDRIIETGIPRVVIAMKDPNPLVAGKGIKRLRRAGVGVTDGVLESQARELNHEFITHIIKKRPFIHVKIAQSLDGKIATLNGKLKWISSGESRRLVHIWRAEHDAILVGAGTLNADNPLLTVRLVKGRNPSVVVLDGNLNASTKARVFRTARERKLIIFTSTQAATHKHKKVDELTSLGATVVALGTTHGRLSLKHVLKKLYQMNLGTVLVEGGRQVFEEFLEEGLTDRLSVFLAPLFMRAGIPVVGVNVAMGPLPISLTPNRLRAQIIGTDVVIQYDFA